MIQLVVVDVQSATADWLLQFLVMTLGETRQSTPAINKTLNPEWFVSFDLPITGPRCLLLEAVCWDKDRFGKDYLGEFDVLVEDIFVNGSTTQEVRVTAISLRCWLTFEASMVYSQVKTEWSKEEGVCGIRRDPSTAHNC